MIKKIFSAEDLRSWASFRLTSTLTAEERELVATLHAKYFEHPYHNPKPSCNCSSDPVAKTFKRYIQQLNEVYKNSI